MSGSTISVQRDALPSAVLRRPFSAGPSYTVAEAPAAGLVQSLDGVPEGTWQVGDVYWSDTPAVVLPVLPAFGIPGPAITGERGAGEVLSLSLGTYSGGGTIDVSVQWTVDGVPTSSTGMTFVDPDGLVEIAAEIVLTNTAGTATLTVYAPAPDLPLATEAALTFSGYDLGEKALFGRPSPIGLMVDGSPWVSSGGTPLAIAFSAPSALLPRIHTNASAPDPSGASYRGNGTELNPGRSPSGATLAQKQAANREGRQGYDELDIRDYWVDYDAALNVDAGATGSPLLVTEGALVHARSMTTAAQLGNTGRPTLDFMLSLHVFDSPPPVDAFPPGFADPDKTIRFTKADLRLDLLGNLAVNTLVNRPPPASFVIGVLSQFWTWQHTYNATSENIRPLQRLSSAFPQTVAYGGGVSSYGGDFWPVMMGAMVWLHTNAWTSAEKERVAILLATHGIHVASRAREGGVWLNNGGHSLGYKELVVFAKFIFQTSTVDDVLAMTQTASFDNSTPGQSIWSDDLYFKYVTAADRTASQGALWTNAADGIERDVSIPADMLGWPEQFGETERNPVPCNAMGNALANGSPPPAADFGRVGNYMFISCKTAAPAAMALHLMAQVQPALKAHLPQVYYDFIDRYMDYMIAGPLARNSRVVGGADLRLAGSNNVTPALRELWTARRAAWGAIWAPPGAATVGKRGVLMIGQSEPAYVFETGGSGASSFQQIAVPNVRRDGALTIYQVQGSGDPDVNGGVVGPLVKTVLTQANRASVNPTMVALENWINHLRPTWELGVGEATEQGTSRVDFFDETDPDRELIDTKKVIDAMVADGFPINRMADFWYAADVGLLNNFEREFAPGYWGQHSDNRPYALGTVHTDGYRDRPVSFCLFDHNSSGPTDRGAGLLTRATAHDLVRKGPWWGDTVARLSGIQTFASDARFISQGGRYGPPACTWANDGHPIRGHWHGLVEAMYEFIGPSVLRALDLPCDEPFFSGIEPGPGGAYLDVVLTRPQAGVLSSKARVNGEANPSPLPFDFQEAFGFEILRAGDATNLWGRVTRADETTYDAKYRGTATLHSTSRVRIVLNQPWQSGDKLRYMWGPQFLRSDVPWSVADHPTIRMGRHCPVEHVAAYRDPTALYPFGGIPVRTWSPEWTVAGVSAVADTTAPTLSASSPADEATNVPTNAVITLTFQEAVQFGTGLITLRQLVSGSWSDAETFDVTTEVGSAAGQVSVAGSVVTIRPTVAMGAAQQYALRVAPTAIRDTAGNAFAGIATDGAINWTTAATQAQLWTQGAAGPYFQAASTPTNQTTRVRFEVRMRVPTSVPAWSGSRSLFTQRVDSLDFALQRGSVGSTLLRLDQLRDGDNTIIATGGMSSTMLGFNGLADDTWHVLAGYVDLASSQIVTTRDGGVPVVNAIPTTPNPAYFFPGRGVAFMAAISGSGTATDIVPEGVQVEYARAWMTTNGVETQVMNIAGNAATVNAITGKGGSNAT